MPLAALKEFLDDNGVHYVTIQHSPAYTAQRIAASAHIPGMELAKTVMVHVDDRMVMVVLPSSVRIDFDLLREATGAEHVELAEEREFAKLFPNCEVGAMPPFGNLYGLEVFVAHKLTEDREIAFNAGTHRELVQLAYEDFDRLVKPSVMQVSI